MAISVARNAKSPPSPNPSHMLINSILIQTDDGRRYDSSIVYNRIIDDPYYRKRRSSLKTVIICFLTIAITAYLLVSESIGFSSFPLAVTDRKYLGRKPNIGSAEDFASSEDNDVKEALSLADDEVDDELRGTGDDDTQDVDASPGHEDQDEDIQRTASRDGSIATDSEDVKDASASEEGPVSIDTDADGDDDSSNKNEADGDEEMEESSISDHDEIGNGEDSTNASGQHLQSTPEEKELNRTIDNTELRVENSTTHEDGGGLAEGNDNGAADGFSPANKEDISDVDDMQNEGEYVKTPLPLKQYDAATLDAVESTVLSHLRVEQDNVDDINEEKTEYKSGDEGSDAAPVESESNAG